MKGTAEFHQEARKYFETHFGPESERAKRYQTVYDAQTEDDYIHAVDELRQAEVENILSIQHVDHPVQRRHCYWEILLATGGLPARVVVLGDPVGCVLGVTFQYQDSSQTWYTLGEDDQVLTDWVSVAFSMECPRRAHRTGRR